MSSGIGITKGDIIILRKWYETRRSLWERVALEDPLDPPPVEPPKPEPYAVTSVTTCTIFVGPDTTASTPTTVPIYLKFSDGRVAREVPAGTMATGMNGDLGMGTSVPYNNYPQPSILGRVIAPWPRNRHDERVFRSIEKNQGAVLRRAEKALGRRSEAKSQEEWNARFWELLKRPAHSTHNPLDKCRRR